MKYGNLTLGFCSWGFRETPLEKQLQIACKNGVDVVELGIHGHENDYLQLSPTDEQIANVKSLFTLYGIKLLCASTGNDFTEDSEESCKTALSNVKNVIETCAKLGVKYLRIFAGFSPAEEVVGERYARLINCLNEVYAHAEKFGVIPVIETHGGVNGYDDGVTHFTSVSTKMEMLLDILSKVKGAKLNFDPANVVATGVTDINSYYKKIENYAVYFHLKDFKTLPSGHLYPTYCGNGSVNWGELLPLLKDKDAPALFEYEVTEDIEYGLQQCLNHVLSFK